MVAKIFEYQRFHTKNAHFVLMNKAHQAFMLLSCSNIRIEFLASLKKLPSFLRSAFGLHLIAFVFLFLLLMKSCSGQLQAELDRGCRSFSFQGTIQRHSAFAKGQHAHTQTCAWYEVVVLLVNANHEVEVWPSKVNPKGEAEAIRLGPHLFEKGGYGNTVFFFGPPSLNLVFRMLPT